MTCVRKTQFHRNINTSTLFKLIYTKMLFSSPKLDRTICPDLLLVTEARKYERTILSLPFKHLQEFCSGGGSQWRCQLLTSFWVRLFLPFTFQQLKLIYNS